MCMQGHCVRCCLDIMNEKQCAKKVKTNDDIYYVHFLMS